MFAPLHGVVEDPATGSANAPLGALLLSLTGEAEGRYEIAQGVEMGRPSLLRVAARRAPDGIRATVGGGCVPVLRGEAAVRGRARGGGVRAAALQPSATSTVTCRSMGRPASRAR
jgi:hypothetical protein